MEDSEILNILLSDEEWQRFDCKRAAINPAKLLETVVAFTNTEGGKESHLSGAIHRCDSRSCSESELKIIEINMELFCLIPLQRVYSTTQGLLSVNV